MKLVEILARELDEWPDEGGEYDVKFITQTARGCIETWEDDGLLVFQCGEWSIRRSIPVDELVFEQHELATDHATAIVTREMWEAERARLKAPKEWRGPQDGLPPVGTRVMFRNHECEVVGYHDDTVVCAMGEDYELSCYDGFLVSSLRPIQSDRDKWIEAALKECTDHISKMQLGKIYDAGLAKLPE